ncbi:MAG: hypothetical protein EHM58_03865 [Ignavibacteriae bacterium]|nr:MAG: hypothetical protein EHM58_03865 [Ignavibacteriota bacterium]
MKKILIPILLVLFIYTAKVYSSGNGEELSSTKMKQVTTEILEIFKSGQSDKLKKYISEDWLEIKHVNLKKYKINNYSPEEFEVLFASGDICIATIGGTSWKHLLAFKFKEEYGQYRVIPMGISDADNGYIDPWWYVKDYICSEHTDN